MTSPYREPALPLDHERVGSDAVLPVEMLEPEVPWYSEVWVARDAVDSRLCGCRLVGSVYAGSWFNERPSKLFVELFDGTKLHSKKWFWLEDRPWLLEQLTAWLNEVIADYHSRPSEPPRRGKFKHRPVRGRPPRFRHRDWGKLFRTFDPPTISLA